MSSQPLEKRAESLAKSVFVVSPNYDIVGFVPGTKVSHYSELPFTSIRVADIRAPKLSKPHRIHFLLKKRSGVGTGALGFFSNNDRAELITGMLRLSLHTKDLLALDKGGKPTDKLEYLANDIRRVLTHTGTANIHGFDSPLAMSIITKNNLNLKVYRSKHDIGKEADDKWASPTNIKAWVNAEINGKSIKGVVVLDSIGGAVPYGQMGNPITFIRSLLDLIKEKFPFMGTISMGWLDNYGYRLNQEQTWDLYNRTKANG